MKNLIATLLSVMMIVCLVGCGGKPSHMDDNTYKLGCKALEIMEAYNDMEIGKDEAENQLEEIYDRLSSKEYDEDHSSESIWNSNVNAYVLGAQIGMTSGKDITDEITKLKKMLNK